MNAKRSIGAVMVVFSLAVCAAVAQESQARGQIKLCRIPGIPGADNRETVYVPGDGSYGGACDGNGENCRDIVVKPTASAHLKPGAGSCVVLDAVLVHGDGRPLAAGDQLIPQWDTGTLESKVTVTKTFR